MKKGGNPDCNIRMIQHRTFASMHSVLDMIFPEMSDGKADALLKKIRAEADFLENILSAYHHSGETFILNEKAEHNWMPVSERLWDILTECRHFHQLSKGYFDIGSGWNKKGIRAVSESSITGIRLLESDEGQRRIRFSGPEIALDFGGIGKGLLLREIDKILTQYDVQNCFISFGGSSILTRGHHPHGDYWPVGYRSHLEINPVFHMRDEFASFSQGSPDGINATACILNPYTNTSEVNSRISGAQAGCPVIAEVASTVLILALPGEMASLAASFGVGKAVVLSRNSSNQPVNEFYYES